jgi:hypothetical protein
MTNETNVNPFANKPLPWDDASLDHEFNAITGALPTIKLSESMDRTLLLVSKMNGMTMAAFAKKAIADALKAETEVLKVSYRTEVMQRTQAILLAKRSDVRSRKEMTKAKTMAAKKALENN